MAVQLTDDKEVFCARLRELTVDAGGIKNFSERVDISYPAARKYLAGSEPSRAVLMKIINSLGVNPDWLLLGFLPKYGNADIDTSETQNTSFFRLLLSEAWSDEVCRRRLSKSDRDLVDAYLNNGKSITLSQAVHLADILNLRIFKASDVDSNSHTRIPLFSPKEHENFSYREFEFIGEPSNPKHFVQSSRADSPIALKKDFLLSEFDGTKDELVLFKIMDRSMEPAIPHHSYALIDCSRRQLTPGALYLFRLNNTCVIRRAFAKDDLKKWSLCRADGSSDGEFENAYLTSSGCIVGKVCKAMIDVE